MPKIFVMSMGIIDMVVMVTCHRSRSSVLCISKPCEHDISLIGEGISMKLLFQLVNAYKCVNAVWQRRTFQLRGIEFNSF